jgi:hypothetical protein
MTGKVIQSPSSVAPDSTYTSFVSGQTLTAALNIELDVPVVPFATPMGAALVRIWGISLQEISQASDLNGMNIAVYAGMQKGLPLANPAQAGLIMQGVVFQAFGNWIGVNQTLDLICQPSIGTDAVPKNFSFNWKAGTPLAQAISNTLSTAFPGTKQNINISPNLVLAHDEPGYYKTLVQFATYVKQKSADVIGGNYPGVDIVLKQNEFDVYDGTTPTTPTQIAFQDMIGQPTWIAPQTIQVAFVMRADLEVGGYIKMPPSIVTTTSSSFSQFRSKSAFQGVFQINQIRHVGNYRQQDAASWATAVNAFVAAA